MTAQLSANRLDLPPPPDLDLLDREQRVGWIVGDAVGFRGFADETEAAHAAWVSYRVLARRLARAHGTRPVPIDTEPLALRRHGDEESILASGRPIARLVRPGADSPSGADSFGFEIRVPPPADELRVRSMGHLMYRTLRKSGLRWTMWRPAPTRVPAAAAPPPESERVPAAARGISNRVDGTSRARFSASSRPIPPRFAPTAKPLSPISRRNHSMSTQHGTNRMAVPPPEARKTHTVALARVSSAPSPTKFVAKVVFAAIAIVVTATLLVIAPRVVTLPILVVLAVGFLVSCVLVTGDGWLVRRLVRGSARHPVPRRRRSDGPAPAHPTRERRGHRRTGAARWQALAAIALASVTLLLLALVAPERLGVVLAATGLLGLVGLRLSATFGRWGPHSLAEQSIQGDPCS